MDVRWIAPSRIETREWADVPALLERDDGFLWVDVHSCDCNFIGGDRSSSSFRLMSRPSPGPYRRRMLRIYDKFHLPTAERSGFEPVLSDHERAIHEQQRSQS